MRIVRLLDLVAMDDELQNKIREVRAVWGKTNR